MISELIKNLANIRTTALGLATLLISLGAAIQSFADGDATTAPDWASVTAAASSFVSSLWLIFGAKD